MEVSQPYMSADPDDSAMQLSGREIVNLRFPRAALIITREAPDEPAGVTVAQAAVTRSTQRQRLELRMPAKNAANTLQSVGLNDLEKVQVTRAPAGDRGVFTRLNSLGMTAAFFARETDEDDAKSELDEEYEFVQNFPLALPPRVLMADAAATRGRAALVAPNWPTESGIGQAHDQGIRGAGVLVGVLDTGVDADHEEFARQTVTYRYVSLYPNSPYWPPRDVRGFDTDGHGTHVSGIIAGQHVGVAPEVSLYVASVIESETTRTSLIRVAYGLDWILRQFSRPDNEHRPGVLNMSLGFADAPPADVTAEEYTRRLRVLRRLIVTLVQANVLPVIAIGNEGAGRYGFPGGFKEVLGVGAVDFQGRVARFSGSGLPPGEGVSKPDIVGYGVGVYSSVERDYQGNAVYQRFNGTSMATPFVTGVAALYRCEQPRQNVADVWQRLVDSALPLGGQPQDRIGAGLARFLP